MTIIKEIIILLVFMVNILYTIWISFEVLSLMVYAHIMPEIYQDYKSHVSMMQVSYATLVVISYLGYIEWFV